MVAIKHKFISPTLRIGETERGYKRGCDDRGNTAYMLEMKASWMKVTSFFLKYVRDHVAYENGMRKNVKDYVGYETEC